MFLEEDRNNASKELQCYKYLKDRAVILLEQGKFDEALIYHQNMVRSINELKRMHNGKLQEDQIQFLVKQIESTQQHHDLIHKMRASQ